MQNWNKILVFTPSNSFQLNDIAALLYFFVIAKDNEIRENLISRVKKDKLKTIQLKVEPMTTAEWKAGEQIYFLILPWTKRGFEITHKCSRQ